MNHGKFLKSIIIFGDRRESGSLIAESLLGGGASTMICRVVMSKNLEGAVVLGTVVTIVIGQVPCEYDSIVRSFSLAR